MNHFESLVQRIERLAKQTGRTEQTVSELARRELDMRVARDGAVDALRQVKAERDKLQTQLAAAETDRDMWRSIVGDKIVTTLDNQIASLRAEVEMLRAQLAAAGDSGELERLREFVAEIREAWLEMHGPLGTKLVFALRVTNALAAFDGEPVQAALATEQDGGAE